MTKEQIVAMLEQYAQDGKDAGSLLKDYNTLASTGKTSLGLNQWDKSDKPTMEDFNEDNRILDEAIVGLGTEVGTLSANKANKDGTIQSKLNADLIDNYHANDFIFSKKSVISESTVLSWVNAQTTSVIQFALVDTPITKATDAPWLNETQYMLIYGDGTRRTVLAYMYQGTKMAMRHFFAGIWISEWIEFAVSAE